MKNFTYNSNGTLYTVCAVNIDRARVAAKRLAGSNWNPKARLVKVSFGGAA